MIIFSNTTPFIALASVNRLDLLPALFDIIHVVDDVVDECAYGGFIVVPDLRQLSWVKVVPSPTTPSASILLELDRGERFTISAAMALNADKVIIDEKIGRNVAEYLGLSVVGTLGILLQGKQEGLIQSFSEIVREMRERGIRYHPELVQRLAKMVGE